jgi:hypothetical protein
LNGRGSRSGRVRVGGRGFSFKGGGWVVIIGHDEKKFNQKTNGTSLGSLVANKIKRGSK